MKNSFSNVWLLGLVALFIFAFSGYLAITISYSKAFKVKNEVVSIIERMGGVSSNTTYKVVPSKIGTGNMRLGAGTIQTINLYLNGSAYKVRHGCPLYETTYEWYGVSTLSIDDNTPYEKAQPGKKYYYCLAKRGVNGSGIAKRASYYKVQLFYKMDVPVLGDMFTFRVDGTTKTIYDKGGITEIFR